MTSPHGSVLLAIIFHAANNLSANILPAIIPALRDVGVAVIVFAGPTHLGREGPPAIGEATA